MDSRWFRCERRFWSRLLSTGSCFWPGEPLTFLLSAGLVCIEAACSVGVCWADIAKSTGFAVSIVWIGMGRTLIEPAIRQSIVLHEL